MLLGNLLLTRTNSGITIFTAVIFTIASLIAIYGAYLIYRPSPESDDLMPYRSIQWLGTQAQLEPRGSVNHSFHVSKNQLVQVDISPRYLTEIVGDPLREIYANISISITDPEGIVLLDQKNVNDAGDILSIEHTGEHNIQILNNQDRRFAVSISVWTVEQKRSPSESFNLMIMFMSLPVFLLGIWLFVAKHLKSRLVGSI